MSPRKKAQVAFVAAVMLLCLAGLAGYLTIARFLESEKSVIHTHEVRDALAEVDWAMLKAARARSGYAISGKDDLLAQFEAAVAEISGKLRHLRDLTQDNPKQQGLCSRLEDITARRVALLRESMEMKNETPGSEQRLQAEFAREDLPLGDAMSSAIQQMREEEDRLLAMRKAAMHRLFVLTVITLSVAFVLAFILFSVQYHFLSTELTAREQAERVARESEESLRRLTGSLLKLQDAERRKFSRELHDGLGQYLAGVKITLEMYAMRREDNLLAEAARLLDQSIAETRTISHLLHPPLLDEVGFSSAAKWYLEGFAQRSGIDIQANLPDDGGGLPKPVSLGLFRVLQESLTNIHRHSASTKAEVALTLLTDQVTLSVRDYGKGIAPELLESFWSKGTKAGIGMAGMRERIRDLGGQLTIQRCAPGTLITVTMPISASTSPTVTPAD